MCTSGTSPRSPSSCSIVTGGKWVWLTNGSRNGNRSLFPTAVNTELEETTGSSGLSPRDAFFLFDDDGVWLRFLFPYTFWPAVATAVEFEPVSNITPLINGDACRVPFRLNNESSDTHSKTVNCSPWNCPEDRQMEDKCAERQNIFYDINELRVWTRQTSPWSEEQLDDVIARYSASCIEENERKKTWCGQREHCLPFSSTANAVEGISCLGHCSLSSISFECITKSFDLVHGWV